ncbi:MAG: SMEK domain-containing protein [Clostridia bacterium]|nr:SMEK domain-containing protein [Clostridia bacterium]
MKQEKLIKSCSELLFKLCDLVESNNTLNYYDVNISSESFFIPLLNLIFDCNLSNINFEERNATAIDLVDNSGGIAIQVTSDSSANKIHNTIKKFIKNKLYEKYHRIIFVVIVRSHNYQADFSKDTAGKINFSKSNDIITIESLIKAISALDIEKIDDIYHYLEYQLGTLLDKSKVENISQSFDYISQNTNNILNESFFEIDDESFIENFQKEINNAKTIHISSLSSEEGRYCILNLLHKSCNKTVLTIKSKDAWDQSEKYLSDCILIPSFQADEIPAIKNNITIFIHSANHNKYTLRLPCRTISFISKKLQDNGYNNPYELIQKTNGLYYYIKSELYTGKACSPRWENDNDNAIITAMLLGRWTECEGDMTTVEQLYGDKYDCFINYLCKYIEIEDALIVRKLDFSNKITYELAEPLLAVFSHKHIVYTPIINTFFNLSKSILSNCDPVFDEPIERHFYLADLKKPKYSHNLKTGILYTLILLALYADCQEKVSHIVNDIFMQINSTKEWAYISQFIELFCEAAPDIVLNHIESGTDNHTGLIDLFTIENPNVIVGRHYYTHILWCLERLIQCKKYASRVVSVLFQLGEHIDNCSTGNSPRDTISKVFCTWYNVSALQVREKIELAEIGVKNHTFFWNVLNNEIDKNNTIVSNSSFIYRNTDEIAPYTQRDYVNLIDSYTDILISFTDGNIERFIKIIDILPKCSEKSFAKLKIEFSNALMVFNDFDKEQIKLKLRKIIYNHRHFANAEWVASPERINEIEKMCLEVHFVDPAYDFLYLTETSDIPIMNPVAYDSEGNYYQNNILAIENIVASEMKKLKELGIDLAHFLSLRKIESYSRIGRAIAKYYCESEFDTEILDIIIESTNNTYIAVDYTVCCSNSDYKEVYSAIDYLRNKHFADMFYIALISVLPFDDKAKMLVQELPNDAARSYWSSFRKQLKNKDLLNEAIKNLIEYQNWNELFIIAFEQRKMLSVEEILSIISDSTNLMINEKHQSDSIESYYIEKLLSVVYERIGAAFENYPTLFELEMRLFNVLGWDKMKCCQYLFKRNANYYADVLSLINRKKDDSISEELKPEKIANLFCLENDIKFCPGEENGSIDKDVFNGWIDLFHKRLLDQGQTSLFHIKLGKLFACSPIDPDGLFPHRIIREKIEEIGNDDLINAFADSVIYGRGMYTVTAGKNEYLLSKKYETIREKLAVHYPKTSKIFSVISDRFLSESKAERRVAETTFF